MKRSLVPWLIGCWSLLAIVAGGAENLPLTRQPTTAPFVNPAGIAGSLLISGGGVPTNDAIRTKFMEIAGGKQARLVIIPTSRARYEFEQPAEFEQRNIAPWRVYEPASITILHTRSKEEANSDEFLKPLQEATGVWFMGGNQNLHAAAYLNTKVETEIYNVVRRGGIVGGTSAGAAIQSRVMIGSGREEPVMTTGLDLLPNAITDQHFLARKRNTRLLRALEQHPGLWGVGVDERTALLVRGRKMEAVGESVVTVVLPPGGGRSARELTLRPGETLDLVALQRAAIARTIETYPPSKWPDPEVKQGSLFIAGGGKLPGEVFRKFFDLAGGLEAPIVVLPTAEEKPDVPKIVAGFRRLGAKNVTVLPQTRRDEVESPAVLDALAAAKGVWFSGGRQWRYIDAYAGTKAEPLLRDVLARGGVIGGGSAGASIQGDYLCRGNPLGSADIMAEGYERGLGFLPGTAIDQHFAQRRRFSDMTSLMKSQPQLLGIGIDEATAVVVKGTTAEVLGTSAAHFYDYRKGQPTGDKDHVSLKAGQKFDLRERKLLD